MSIKTVILITIKEAYVLEQMENKMCFTEIPDDWALDSPGTLAPPLYITADMKAGRMDIHTLGIISKEEVSKGQQLLCPNEICEQAENESNAEKPFQL